MPSVKLAPQNLQPYLFHGVNLSWHNGDQQAIADCPWCGREGKFSVEIRTGLWRCWICQEGNEKGGGNSAVFLRLLYEKSLVGVDYLELAEDRSLLYPDTLRQWGVGRINGTWVLAGYGADGKLRQLYRYARGKERTMLLPTPGFGHQLFGMSTYRPGAPLVYLCEGPWDGMVVWELLTHAKEAEGLIVPTANRERSLASQVNVLAVPTCSVFKEEWASLFSGKDVVLLYDNDHPQKHPASGKLSTSAALAGMHRVAGILSRASNPPITIRYLRWGKGGYNPDLPHGFDVRDCLTKRGIYA